MVLLHCLMKGLHLTPALDTVHQPAVPLQADLLEADPLVVDPLEEELNDK